jgi:hypothetical protein
MPTQPGSQEREIMNFLHERVFDPILNSPRATNDLKQGVRLTIVRMEQHTAPKMIQYFWSAVMGTDRSVGFAAKTQATTVHVSGWSLVSFVVEF